jgi:hypothetical protein
MATYQTYQQIGMAEDVSDVIANISPTSTPMQSMFKTDKVHARTFEYQEDAIRASAVNAAVEGADASYITIAATTMRSNTTQIFSEAFQVSNTAETVRTYGRAKETAYQLAKTLKALKLDYERALCGVSQAMVAGSASAARKMASMDQQISTTVDAGSNSTDALTESKLLDLSEDCFTNGSECSVLSIKPADSTIVAGFATATGRNREIDNKTLINTIDVLITPFFETKVVLNRQQANLSTHAYLMDPSMFRNVVLRPYTRTAMAVTGDSQKHLVTAELSNKHLSFADSGMITGLS